MTIANAKYNNNNSTFDNDKSTIENISSNLKTLNMSTDIFRTSKKNCHKISLENNPEIKQIFSPQISAERATNEERWKNRQKKNLLHSTDEAGKSEYSGRRIC